MINYFDFGLHKGDEITMFLDAIQPINSSVNVYGFEAHPDLHKRVKKRFEHSQDINIFNKAISNKNSKVNLYIAPNNKMEGNSIFPTKNNVSSEYVEVDGILFSDWLLKNVPNYKEAVNVIRFNIEGAELFLIDDLINSGIYKEISLFIGSRGGEDILKCSEIAHLHSDYEKKLIENSISVYQFCSASVNNISNENICKILNRAINHNE
jgi:FkbM family methyltransferase